MNGILSFNTFLLSFCFVKGTIWKKKRKRKSITKDRQDAYSKENQATKQGSGAFRGGDVEWLLAFEEGKEWAWQQR